MEEKFRLPETSVVTKDCLSKDFIFEQEARSILKKIGAIIQNEVDEEKKDDEKSYYVNNIIGIIGGRGSGKTSLIASILETIRNKDKNVYIDISEVQKSDIICLVDLIDPKAIPDFIGIIDLVLASLFSYFKEGIKDIKETERESLFQKFERLNKIVSILSQTQRTEVIENPGDLYDLASLVTLRSALEELVQDLLGAQIPKEEKTKRENERKSVFIIAIDDFDLDTTNSLRMLYELSTFLNIRGIIFMLAMDEQVFNYEIERARIKEMSDFGRATEQIVEIASQSRSSARFRSIEPIRIFNKDTVAKFGVETIASQAREYRSQLTTKFIPFDFRFDMKAHGFAKDEGKFEMLVDDLSDWLFGFSKTDLPWKGKLASAARMFCGQFRNALVMTSNLRSRNQILNRILDLLTERKIFQEPFEDFYVNDNSNLKLLSDALKNYPPVPSTRQKDEREILRKLAQEIDNAVNLVDRQFDELSGDSAYSVSDSITDGENSTSIYDLFQSFWAEHPCAYFAYQQIVSKIDSYDYEEFATLYLELLKFYRNKTVGNKVNLQKSENGYEIGAVVLSAMSLHENLLAVDFRNISRDLRIMLNMLKSNSAKIVKRDVLNLLTELRDYFRRKEGFPMEQLEELNDLRKRLQGIPWTKDSEEKRDVLDELRKELEKLGKYLR